MRIVPVHSVTNLDNENSSVEAEVALVYFFVTNENKKNLFRYATYIEQEKLKMKIIQ